MKISEGLFRIESDMEIEVLIKRVGPSDFNFEFAQPGLFGSFHEFQPYIVANNEYKDDSLNPVGPIIPKISVLLLKVELYGKGIGPKSVLIG